jgi:hypothetical protein
MPCKTTTSISLVTCAVICEPTSQQIPTITFDGKYISTSIVPHTLYKWFVLVDNGVIYETSWARPSDSFTLVGGVFSNILVGLNGNNLKNAINTLPNTKIDKTNNLSLYLLTKQGEIISNPSNKIYFQI